ncbi:putative HNH endonuclease domain protein [Escherichia coli 3-073-06_S1_C1]|nr:putative HNH endonuclease domain protein [Escherichia coli 3-073-06_S1_C1]
MCDEFVNDAKIAETNENFFKKGSITTNELLDDDIHLI